MQHKTCLNDFKRSYLLCFENKVAHSLLCIEKNCSLIAMYWSDTKFASFLIREKCSVANGYYVYIIMVLADTELHPFFAGIHLCTSFKLFQLG